MSSTSTRNRRKTRTAPAPAEAPGTVAIAVAVVVDDESCQVCHIPLDEKTMKNHGTKKLPYWMCRDTGECDGRVREARDRELQAEAGESETETTGATGETAEVSR
jgi:hypothetical protein